MAQLYLVTGAAGHLGLTVVQALVRRGETVRALVLPNDPATRNVPKAAQVFEGDVRDPQTLLAAFAVAPGDRLTVIHCAGIVTIASRYVQSVYDVNVTGTKNIVDACVARRVRKLVYVSSVHAVPILPKGEVIREVSEFNPETVTGLYAQTKAEATAYVLKAVRERGLNASVVHPSGISGPGDYGNNHMTQLVRDWSDGRLTAGIRGGYDFVDVRDVADGILACCERGRSGECYFLTNRYVTVQEIFDILCAFRGRKRMRTFLPLWFIKLTAPLAELYYRLLRQKPLFTRYSVFTLESNAIFSHEKATRELHYQPRAFEDTLRDTLLWCESIGLVKPARKQRPSRARQRPCRSAR